jgi:hypothetical protein
VHDGYQRGFAFGRCGRGADLAVNASVSGVNIHTVGVILLIVGAVGVATSLVFWSSWGGFGGRDTTVIHDRGVER